MAMKAVFLILVCLLCKSVSAQTIPVFQVLYAEKASLSNGTALKSLDKLLDETIHVADSGYLILIHETGIPLELNGDTTIMLSEALGILNPKSLQGRSSYQKSVGLDYLFLSQGTEAKRFRLSRTGAIHDDRLAYVIYPPLINGRIYFDEDVKIIWRSNFSGINIAVQVKNVFDEELKYTVKDSLVLIHKEELNSQDVDCIVTFTQFTGNQRKVRKNHSEEGHYISHFYTDKITFPYPAEIKTPAAALMAGYFLEMGSFSRNTVLLRISSTLVLKKILSRYARQLQRQTR